MMGQELLVLLGLVAVVAGQSCMAPFVPVGGKCFYVEFSEQEGQGMSWQDSRDYCKALGGSELNADLASFPTCDQFTEFARYLAFNVPSNASLWMGAHTLFSPNMWQWVTLEALQTGVPFWYYKEDFHEAKECAASDEAYYSRLVAADCGEAKGFACTYTPTATIEVRVNGPGDKDCPQDSIFVGDNCYVFHHESEEFERAEERCRDEHDSFRGELYYPSGCHEFTHMAHHLEATEEISDYWVGAIDISGEDEWTWVNGELLSGGPPYWASGEPSHDHETSPREHCAHMCNDERFYLKDAHCNEKRHFICKLTVIP